MNELSIRGAAADSGDRPAIITPARVWTFGECARLVRRSDAAIVASTEVSTILGIYAALESERPVAMLHAKMPFADQQRQRAIIAAASLPPGSAFVLFTSGSTREARGVVLSRDAIIAAALASEARFGWRPDDAWLLPLPLAHSGGLSIVIRCLIARKPIILVEREGDLVAMLPKATLASFVPAQLEALVGKVDPSHLRAVVLGGAAAPPSLIERALAAGWPVHASYGLTETFGQIATAKTPGGPLEVLPGVEITCDDTIAIRAPQLATAYLDGTPIAPRFVTADLGTLDADGTLHVLGRRDDVIISGGEKIHPLEVEAVLAATPGVTAASVFGLPDAKWGSVVGAALATTAAFDRTSALAAWHRALPAFARPRRLVMLTQLPALPSGKLDRRAIATLATDPIDY